MQLTLSKSEFFIFDDVRFETNMNGILYQVNSEELPF